MDGKKEEDFIEEVFVNVITSQSLGALKILYFQKSLRNHSTIIPLNYNSSLTLLAVN